MKKVWLRICSLVLVVAMTVNLLPLTTFAEQHQSNPSTSPVDVSSTSNHEEAIIVAENTDNRTEYSKEFLLNNGLSLAVVYNSAVHYQDDGQWKEIDNTLQSKRIGTITNTSGVWDISFPQQITNSNHISITKDGYTLSFGMAGELYQMSNVEIMSAEDETEKESSDGDATDLIESEQSEMASTEAEASPTVPNSESTETNNEETLVTEVLESETPVAEATETVESTVEETVSEEIGIEEILVKETNIDEIEASETIPEETVSEATVSEETAPEEIALEETVSEETVPEETVPEETVPEETEPEETVPEETVPEETIPEETIPEETVPEETIPEETDPEETTPEESVPEEEATIPEINAGTLDLTAEMESISVNGVTQTFGVHSVKSTLGKIQAIDSKAILEEVEYEETVLQKPVSQLLYSNVYTNTDVKYDLIGNQLKESIILESYNSSIRGYRYSLNTGDMIPVLNDDGSIYLYDENKETIVMVMPSPYLEDSNMAYCDDVQVTLTGSNGTYTLCYLLPTAWLAEKERAWPVILDPVVSANLNINNIQDKTVGSYRDYNHTVGVNTAGFSSDCGIQRCFVKYNALPGLSSSDVILSASLQMYKPKQSSAPRTIEVHKVTDTWTSSSMTWGNQPGHNAIVEDYQIAHYAGFYCWDITDIARGWYSGENTGMLFKVSNSDEWNTGVPTWTEFYSSDYGSAYYMPTMWIYFRNNNGLENYWDYTTSSAGRAGTGYVNQYTGNLVWIHSDLGFGGNRMPVSISHVYNANDNTLSQFGAGTGWRMNYNQRVYQWNSNTNYYIWEDSDGTKHYFLYDSPNTYKDEDGLELTLTTGGSGSETFCITDKNGNKSYFDNIGRLTKQENNQATKSSITITYDSTKQWHIREVTDGAGRKYNFTYSNDLLDKISYIGTGTKGLANIIYGYTDGKLTSVTYDDGETTTFSYGANNVLVSATDIDGYTLQYAYNTTTTGQPSRVSQISEYDGDVVGGLLNIEYAHNQTTLTDHNGNVQILQFNNLGNTVCIQDGEGRAQYAKYAKNDSGSTGKGNQLTASSKLQNTVSNLLADSSFEGGTAWTANSGVAVVVDTAYLGSKSLAVANGRANGPMISVPAGESITFSAYVKTSATTASLALYAGTSSVATSAISNAANWTRVEVNYTNTSAYSQTITAVAQCNSGTLYLDCAQMEYFPTASRYNLVENGDFRVSGSLVANWTTSGTGSNDGAAIVTTACPQLDNDVMRLVGNANAAKKLIQTVNMSGNAGDSYIVSGWAKADSVPLVGNRQFGIRLIFNNTDGTTTPIVAQFNPDTNTTANWQYSAAAAVAEKAYSSITIEVVYEYNANTAYFDGIQLYKEEFSQSYAYDDDGNVTSVIDLQKQETKYEYTDNNLTKQILPSGAELTYTYDDYHNVLTATTETGVVYKFTYDTYGNNTAVEIQGNGGSIRSSATYSADGNRMVSTTDALGNTTTYHYNADSNLLEWVKYPNDTDATKTEYTYDEMFRMASAAASTDTGLGLSAEYTYTDDLLTAIETASTTYTFGYGNFALRSNVTIGSRTLATYTYTPRDNYLASLDYGNGDRVEYEYDNQGRVTRQTYEDGETVDYRYDNNGALASVMDSATGRTTTYYYDFIDRMMKYVETGNGYEHSVGYKYDTINNLTELVEIINGREYSTSYTYDDDNRVTKVESGTTNKVESGTTNKEYSYDSYGRVGQQTTKHGDSTIKTDAFTFSAPSLTTTSSQVATHTIDAAGYDKTFTYTYDDNGNITEINDGTYSVYYYYDSANQLVNEYDQATGILCTGMYDDAGNLLLWVETDSEGYTTGNSNDYEDPEWGDLLTSNNYGEVASDEIGNPFFSGPWICSWEHGRQLASLTGYPMTWSFTYNADGLRTQRTDGTTTYNYVYNGDKLSQMTVGSNTLNFGYDAAGSPMTLDYNDTTYYYVTNIQGDVIAILNNSGVAVVEYVYDAWGNHRSITGSMATTIGELNPLRYRGYVYDQETGLYYVSSRYYDPEIGRWINADAAIGQIGNVQSTNMFAYCFNNPVNMSDPTGNWPKLSTIFTVVAVAAVAVAAVAVIVATCGAAAPALAVAGGGIIGGISAGAAATAASVATGAMIVAGVSTAAAVTSAVAEKAVEKTAKRNNSVYVLKDDAGTVQYVGRTNNVDKRRAAHSANPARAGLEMEVIASGLNLPESRALEQAGMAYYHTINTANKMNNQINSVSPKYWGAFKELALGTLNYGWNQMSNEILYWTGN